MKHVKHKLLATAGLLIFLFVFCSKKIESQPGNTASASAPTPASSATTLHENVQSSRPATKWALLVGIDKYRHTDKVSNLAGCVNDAMDMKALLIGKFEFPEANILVLANEQATHAGIVAAIQNHLIANAQQGDIVVFHYSGHGSQMKDVSGDEEGDGLDETLVPHDSRDPQNQVFDISDDEINGLLAQLSQKTKNITFIFDSCHSGTATRAAGLMRKIPADPRQPPATAPAYALGTRGAGEGSDDIRLKNLNYVLISGCLSKQTSFEHFAEGKEHGAMTYFLTRELRNSGAATTYADVKDRVQGNVRAVYPNQLPQFEGTDLNRYVFNDSSSIAQPYALASPLGTNQVKLETGEVHGATVGSIFEVYKPGTKKFESPERPLAKVEVTKVGSFTAEAKLVSGAQVPAFSRAVERQHQYPDLKLLVHYKDVARSATLQKIKADLDKLGYIETAPEARNYHLLLQQKDNAIITEGADASEISPRVPVSEENAVGRVVEQVNHWVKWFNLLSIENATATAKITLTVTAVRGGETRNPFAAVGEPEATLKMGEEFECKIENQSGRDLYVSLLDLSTDGSVSVIYPYPEGASELIKPNAVITKRFETFVPEGRESVMDVIKVFATSTPVDFHRLNQPPVRGNATAIANDPLGQMLAQATLGVTRGSRPSAVDLGGWATAKRAFKVTR